MNTLVIVVLTVLVAGSVAAQAPPPPLNGEGPVATEVTVRVVAYGAMVLGDDVGGARVTITDVATGQLLASGMQHGEAGDQNQIMRTPHLMDEPHYSTRPSGAFRATLELERPTLVEVAAQGPLSYPQAMQKGSKTVLLVPGRDLTGDGIVLTLNGFIVQMESPSPGESLMAKDDVTLAASVRTLSGALVRPHGDWDSRKIVIYGELMVGEHVIERLQMFYAGSRGRFEARFFVPTPAEAPNGITLRVVAADGSNANVGVGSAKYPVVPEQIKPRPKS